MFGPTFWFGLLVVLAWTSQDFHEPFTSTKLIYSTPRRRYWFGRLFYIGCGAFAYIIVVLLVLAIIKLTRLSLIQILEGGGSRNGWIVSYSAIICLTAIIYIPGTSRIIAYTRGIAQGVALFPYQLEGLITDISHSAFQPSQEFNAGVLKELSRYGAMPASIGGTITRAAMGSLVELYSLRLRIHRFMSGVQFETYREQNKEALGRIG